MDGEDRTTFRPLRSAVPPPDVPPPTPAAPSATPGATVDNGPAGTGDTATAAATETSSAAKPGTPAEASTTGTPGQTPEKPATPEKTAETAGTSGTPEQTAETSGEKSGRRRRIPFAHAVRIPPPRQAARTAVTATRAWSRRPSGRLALPGMFLLTLVAVAATAGALIVPATIRAPRPVAATAGPQTGWPDGGPVAPTPGVPTGPAGGVTVAPPPGPMTGRPADALAAWAQQTGQRVGIPVVALQAYGYAELVLRNTTPGCNLTWTTLAAIGYVESRHGAANGAVLGVDGQALPKIIGSPLDGQGGRMRIADTDRGVMDGDLIYDRAVGPMQFIPTTWQEIGADADNDGQKSPHDLDDAALAAGNYLCKGGRNLVMPGDWWNAILSYNDVRRYAQDVFDTANRYGVASRP